MSAWLPPSPIGLGSVLIQSGCPALPSPPPLPLHRPPSQSHGPPSLTAFLLRVLPESDFEQFPTTCECPDFGPISEPPELLYKPHLLLRSQGVSEVTEMKLTGQGVWPRMPGPVTPTESVLSRGMCLVEILHRCLMSGSLGFHVSHTQVTNRPSRGPRQSA